MADRQAVPIYRLTVRVSGAAAAGAIAELLDAVTGGVAAFVTGEADAEPTEWLVEAYPPAALLDRALDLRLALAAAARGGAIIAAAEERLAERDWLAENRRAFPPQRIGRFYVHGSHWREPAPPGAIAIEIDAATAFGTGEHPSTRGCLLAFERLARRRRFRRPRDIGTGSGILAIAAAKLARRQVRASDIDPGAVRVARHHARHNGVARLVRAAVASGAAGNGGGSDLVFANILARPLALMARDLARAVAPGGIAILSGLLRRQEAIVLAAFRPLHMPLSFRIVVVGWSSLVLRRPG
jgi:ribosomal protein L11 methyltransferase